MYQKKYLKSLAPALIFYTGCRVGEICGLYKEDIDACQHIINISHAARIDKETNNYFTGLPKCNKSRVVVYPDAADDIRRTYDSILDEAAMPSALRHLLVGHELTGIDSHYLRDNTDIEQNK